MRSCMGCHPIWRFDSVFRGFRSAPDLFELYAQPAQSRSDWKGNERNLWFTYQLASFWEYWDCDGFFHILGRRSGFIPAPAFECVVLAVHDVLETLFLLIINVGFRSLRKNIRPQSGYGGSQPPGSHTRLSLFVFPAEDSLSLK